MVRHKWNLLGIPSSRREGSMDDNQVNLSKTGVMQRPREVGSMIFVGI